MPISKDKSAKGKMQTQIILGICPKVILCVGQLENIYVIENKKNGDLMIK